MFAMLLDYITQSFKTTDHLGQDEVGVEKSLNFWLTNLVVTYHQAFGALPSLLGSFSEEEK